MINTSRAVAHVDLDAFYVAVEVQRDPQRLGNGAPVGVVQYNPFGDLRTLAPDDDRLLNDSNGSLIAVGYAARAHGVKRNMRGDEARKLCPELRLVQVPTAHGKADLTLYRDAGKRVLAVLARNGVAERASIDEAYIDYTAEAARRLQARGTGLPACPVEPERCHVAGQDGAAAVQAWWRRPPHEWEPGELLLAEAAAIVAELRAEVHSTLGYTCSAGIAHNKILAKLGSGLNKPQQQTVVPARHTPALLRDLPVARLRQLGGKLGQSVQERLGVSTVGELAAVPRGRLTALFGDETGSWLFELARGEDHTPVTPRTLPKTAGCGKTFRGANRLRSFDAVAHWLLQLGQELQERLDADRAANGRAPRVLTLHMSVEDGGGGMGGGIGGGGMGGGGMGGGHHGGAPLGGGIRTSLSRQTAMRRPEARAMADDALALVKKVVGTKPFAITDLYLGAAQFAAAPSGNSTMMRFLRKAEHPRPAPTTSGPALDDGHGRPPSPPPQRQRVDPTAAAAPVERQQQEQQQSAGASLSWGLAPSVSFGVGGMSSFGGPNDDRGGAGGDEASSQLQPDDAATVAPAAAAAAAAAASNATITVPATAGNGIAAAEGPGPCHPEQQQPHRSGIAAEPSGVAVTDAPAAGGPDTAAGGDGGRGAGEPGASNGASNGGGSEWWEALGIDEATLRELPPEIRQELQAAQRMGAGPATLLGTGYHAAGGGGRGGRGGVGRGRGRGRGRGARGGGGGQRQPTVTLDKFFCKRNA